MTLLKEQIQKNRMRELVRVCDCIYDSLALLEQPSLQMLIESWRVARAKYIAVAEDRIPGVKISQVAPAFENGLVETMNEIPEILRNAPPAVAQDAINIFQGIINVELPGLIERNTENNNAAIRKIIKRGVIKGGSEFYLIRQAIDELEKGADDEKLRLFYSFLDSYEGCRALDSG